jgi:hypothetical protein
MLTPPGIPFDFKVDIYGQAVLEQERQGESIVSGFL